VRASSGEREIPASDGAPESFRAGDTEDVPAGPALEQRAAARARAREASAASRRRMRHET
jgi:hypothetical protein